ncbi:MAG: hypothetical protein ACLUIS_08035 [Longibaculum sp.]
MNKSKLTKNIYISFGGQLIIIILGLIIPRLFISNYGSDINGLLSTITQIYTYICVARSWNRPVLETNYLNLLKKMIEMKSII